jgi:uncharacterized protein DUF1360
VEPISETPTAPRDYALVSAAYGSLLATLAFAAARGRAEETEPIATQELLPLAAATFAVSQTLVHEKAESWVRRPFVEGEGTDERRPRGTGMRYAVGELLTCTRCVGTWSALGLVALRLTRPAAGRTVVAVLAAAGVNDFLHSAFAWSRASANLTERRGQESADTEADGATRYAGRRVGAVGSRLRG